MRKTKCRVEGCIPVSRITKGLCQKHYQRLRTHGRMADRVPYYVGPCIADGCDRQSEYPTLRLCQRHYHHHWRHGPTHRTCSRCDGRHFARGLCSGHYQELMTGIGHRKATMICEAMAARIPSVASEVLLMTTKGKRE